MVSSNSLSFLCVLGFGFGVFRVFSRFWVGFGSWVLVNLASLFGFVCGIGGLDSFFILFFWGFQ